MSRIDIITLFPDFFSSPLSQSILGRAIRKNQVEVNLYNLRNWGVGPRKEVDEAPFGGGAGMILRVDVLTAALSAVTGKNKVKPLVILLDPAGEKYTQRTAEKLSRKKRLILICGHYEDVDERFRRYVDSSVSIGDFILTGGEPAALVMLDSIVRLIPGVLGKAESAVKESFSGSYKTVSTLDFPQYTKPVIFESKKVPKVLLSGNHQEIDNWRTKKALERTKKHRPDLLGD